jgi:hypothetical protein
LQEWTQLGHGELKNAINSGVKSLGVDELCLITCAFALQITQSEVSGGFVGPKIKIKI